MPTSDPSTTEDPPETAPLSPPSSEDLLFDPSSTVAWVESLLTVPSETGHIVEFRATPQQHLMDEEHTGRDGTVKARQTRASSWIQARNVRRMTSGFGLNCVIVTQTDQMTQLFRARVKHHLKDLSRAGLDFKITIDNKDELVLGDMENRWIFSSGEAKSGGVRGVQSAHIVHLSEVAHWESDPGRIVGGLIPAIPPPPYGWLDIESTPNGADGFFYDFIQDALEPDSANTAHFYPWWIEPAYTIESYRRTKGINVDELLSNFHPTKEEEDLIDRVQTQTSVLLSPAQILWRRLRSRELLKTGQFFAQEYPEDLKKCFLTAGGAFFNDPAADVSHLEWYADQCAAPMQTYDSLPYRSASSIPFYGPHLKIWEPPQPNHTYAMFMDCAAGFGNNEGSDDWTALVVLDAETIRHVATLRVKATPEQCGAMACAVGQFYNFALYGVERNGYGQGALNAARSLTYPNIYYYIDLDQPDAKPQAGWYTSEKTRDMMLTKLRIAIFTRSLTSRDEVFVREAGAFTWQKIKQRGDRMWRAEARSGHDDMVLAMAGALMIRDRAVPRSGLRGQTNRDDHDREDRAGLVIVGSGGVVRQSPPRSSSHVHPWMR